MTTQLRTYDIRDGALDEFAHLVADRIFPLRRAHGFTVHGPWVSREERRYVWLVSYDGAGSFEDAEQRYYDDPARSEIGFDPMDYIEAVQLTMLDSI